MLHGACLDLGGEGLPYLPLVEALRGLARETPPDRLRALIGSAMPDLATLLPELHAMGGPGDDGGDKGAPAAPSGLDRARLFERFLGFLGRLEPSKGAHVLVEAFGMLPPDLAAELLIYGTDADEEALRRDHPDVVTVLRMDVTDAACVTAAGHRVLAAGPLAGLVNNAGVALPAPLEHIPMEVFRRQLEVNLSAPRGAGVSD